MRDEVVMEYKQLDDDPEFQRAVVALGKAMFVDNANNRVRLEHWQVINWLVYKWQKELLAYHGVVIENT